MRLSALVLTLLTSTAGCAATVESAEPASPPTMRTAVVIPPAVEAEPEVAPAPVVAEEAPRTRPRLARTVTLGQGQQDLTYTGPRPVGAPGYGGPGGQPVVVNNNVIVQSAPPAYGYGYGGYGRGGYSRGYDGFTPRTGSGQWGATGFEGSRRTAAPGQTPGVGGNWAPAPSYGPASMR